MGESKDEYSRTLKGFSYLGTEPAAWWRDTQGQTGPLQCSEVSASSINFL